MTENELIYKHVEYEKWCCKCANSAKKETESPCDECLNTENAVNLYSHKPVKFEEK